MARSGAAVVLWLLIVTSLWAADREVSIASVAVGAGKPWQWTVFIQGTPDALAHVKCVRYVLDPSFPNPSRTVCSRGPEDRPFASSGTTWGPFKLLATVTFDDGNVQGLQYSLNPEEAVESAQRKKGISPTPESFKDPLLTDIKPVGLAILKSGDLVIADGYRKHILLKTQAGVRQIVDVSSSYIPLNVSAFELDNQEAILVATNWDIDRSWGGDSRQGRIQMFSATGGLSRALWEDLFKNHLLAGSAWDDNSKALYVTDDIPELFRIRVSGGGLDGHGIGLRGLDGEDRDLLIAVDPKSSSLFAADKKTGHLYRVDMSNGQAHLLVLHGSLGNPATIATSADGNILYSVDGNRIRMVRLDTTPMQVSTFLREPKLFHSLSSLVIGPTGQMWVGDSYAHAIYSVSPEGHVTGVLSAK